ncbi:hypothetical protein Poly24_27180 [Rosistilla carotiformis]|uniref:Uncharacterized protein n=1 Tax=Rosistilla carotiformis TaxID=2528017 RepID=A0A518JTX8_9BACT|nr:hypothetical protein [Rosistilla carotiformis]QDV69004.1 hypothetical protein Poly24_27180 [Rosistilla carotiformis]
MKTKQYRLTKTEKTLLDRIQRPNIIGVCNLMATKMYREHMNVHRGAWLIDDDEFPEGEGECLIFGNDSFTSDVRARKEVAQVVSRLDSLAIRIFEFGLGPDGYTWALWVDSDDEVLLDLIVWDVWFDITCGKVNPMKEKLNEYLDEMGYEVTA